MRVGLCFQSAYNENVLARWAQMTPGASPDESVKGERV